jgi:hypothetical protein
MLVDEASTTLELLIGTLRIPRPRESWRQLMPQLGFDAFWCRLPDLATSPTRLEIISPFGTPDPERQHPHMREILGEHGDRPAKAHSAPITVADIVDLGERLTERGVRFRWDRPTEGFAFDRLWIGFSDDDPVTYVPDDDAGLRLEFLPTTALGLPAEATAPRASSEAGAAGGGYVGVAARIFTTDDLDAVIDTLQRTFAWSPARVVDGEAGRRATWAFAFERSAVVEVVQPAGGTVEHEHLERWGPGPYGIRLAVDGLAAKAAELDAAATPFHRLERDGREVLVVDPAATAGTTFELVEG